MTAFTGTTELLRFALRRDRIRIAIWLASLSIGTVWIVLALAGVYPTAADRQTSITTLNSPAGLAFTGPARYFSDYTLGSMVSHQILGFTAILVGIMSVLFVVRHTRAEEESGRAELIRARVIGRYAPLTSAVLLTVLINLALAVLLAVLLPFVGDESLTWSGSLLYGAAHAAVGISFTGIAALAAQFTLSARGASGLGMAAVGAAYLVRAIGDSAGNNVSWASPIGWAQQAYPYMDNRWWLLGLNLLAGLVLAGLALLLSERRDLGSGMVAPRRGRPNASASLLTPAGFALRLQRGLFIGFAIGMVALGGSYGPFLGEVETSFADVAVIDDALQSIGGATLVDSFLTMLTTILAVVVTIYVVLAIYRVRTEETSGRAEPVVGTWQSRTTYLGNHVAIAMIGGALILIASVAVLVATGQSSVDEPLWGKTLAAALVHVPALWVFAGVATVLVGWLPRATSAIWVLVAWAGIAGYLGPILQLPEWTNRLSPFGYLPDLPADQMTWPGVIGLTIVAAVLVVLGLVGFRRRDLQPG